MWNRLVAVTRAYVDCTGFHTGSTVATMQFDGLGRRVTKQIETAT